MKNTNQPELFDLQVAVWFDIDLSGPAKTTAQILLIYARFFDEGILGTASPSVETIVRLTGWGSTTVYNALKELAAKGWFSRIDRFHKTCLYDLNIGVAVEAIGRARKMQAFLKTAEGKAIWDKVAKNSGVGPKPMKARAARFLELSSPIESFSNPYAASSELSATREKTSSELSAGRSLLRKEERKEEERKKGGAPSSALPLQVVNLTGATYCEVKPDGASKDQNVYQDVYVAIAPPSPPPQHVPATLEKLRGQMINSPPMADYSPATFVEFPTDEIRKQGVYGPITRDEDGRLDFADNERGNGFRKKLMKEYPGLDLRQGLNRASLKITARTPPADYAGFVWTYCGYAFNDMKKAKAKYSNGGSSGGNPVFS